MAMGISAHAGNIALTGHDDDFHFLFGSASAGVQLGALTSFVRKGSANPTLPVLTFDMNGSGHGLELDHGLTALGIPFTNVDPSTGPVSSSVFDPTKYSAFILASDIACGGCDLTPTAEANIYTGNTTAIDNFLNAGGGILGLSGAYADAPFYYSFLPDSASPSGVPPPSPYYATADGLANGIPSVNGDQTHNFFNEPGTGGTSGLYLVAERFAGGPGGTACTGSVSACTPETLILPGAGVSGGGLTTVPEPSSIALFGSGLLALFGLSRSLKRKSIEVA
jgi:hypothetical protein